MATLARLQHVSNYIGDLRSQIGYYMGWVPNEYADQPSEDNFYEILRKDLEVKRCSNLLSLMAAGEVIRVKHKDARIQELSQYALKNIREFLHARKSLIEKGVLFGLGIQKKFYEYDRIDGYEGKWLVPHELREVDRRRLRIERNLESKYTYWTLWDPAYDAYIVLEDLAVNPNASHSVQDYVWFIQEYEELMPYFEGYGDVLYPLIWLKKNVVQYWGDLCESWAKPFLTILCDVMKATMTSDIGGNFPTFEKRREELIKIFEKCRSRHIAVVDKSEELKYHEHGSVGSNILSEFVDYVDRKVNLLFFGTELATTSKGIGSYALGEIHKEEKDTIIVYDRDRLCEVLKYDVLFDFFWRNRFVMAKNGLLVPKPQSLDVKITTDIEEIKKEEIKQDGK